MSDNKTIPQLMPASLKLAEHEQFVYIATVERAVTRADLLQPSFWGHVAQMLKPRYEIKVFCEDDSFYATYLVTACDKTWARVHELSFQHLGGQELSRQQMDEILKDYDINWGGPQKWRVIRKSDRASLQIGMHSKSDAEQWLVIHLNSQTKQVAA